MNLVERFRHGDPDAFEELFRQFQGRVFGWIVKIVRDRGLAEDLTVETFWLIYRARSRFRPDGNFGAWAYRIATNQALKHLRLRRTHSEVPLPADVVQEALPDTTVQHEVGEQILRAVEMLPAKLQVVVMLALVEELPYQEIAVALGVPVATVKTRVFRAVRILRTKLGRMGVEHAAIRG